MASRFRAACIQNTATRDIKANIDWVCRHIEQAAAEGAEFISLAETVALIEPDNERIAGSCYSEQQDPGLNAFCEAAKSLQVTILVGSQLIRRGDGKIVNRCFLVNDRGIVSARYDKLHMFDIQLSNGEFYRESDAITPGDKAIVANTNWGKLGLSICYDLRFAALYRALAQNGAEFITIPAAFTQTTGEAHWHTLIRARAIETGCYVIAANQCGVHVGRRASWGHSLIVDPWGEILADAGPEPGIIYADIDLQKVAAAQGKIPALKHDRVFTLEQQ